MLSKKLFNIVKADIADVSKKRQKAIVWLGIRKNLNLEDLFYKESIGDFNKSILDYLFEMKRSIKGLQLSDIIMVFEDSYGIRKYAKVIDGTKK